MCGEMYETALEGIEAINYIENTTVLSAKKTIGTRIIIFNPKDEIVKSIRDRSIVNFIQESCWRCIEKMSDNSGIYINEEKVKVPKFKPFEKEY